MSKPAKKPVVRLKPSSYQPSKAELEEKIVIDGEPEEIARALLQQVKIVTEPEPAK